MFAISHGIQVNTAKWLIHKLYYTKNDNQAIQFGMFISFIAQKFGLSLKAENPDHYIQFKDPNHLNAQFLVKIKLLERNP